MSSSISNMTQILANRFQFIEYGDPISSNGTILFIHGWLDNAASFETTLNQLNQLTTNWHLIAVDLAGHGFSEHKSKDSFYPFHDYLDDIHQIVSELSASELILVGHSLGALIASCYSAAFPEKVSALVQIEGYGPLAETPTKSVARIKQGIVSRQRIRNKPERQLASFDEALSLRSHVNQLPKALLYPIVKRGTVQVDGKCYWRHDAKLKSDSLYRMGEQHAQAVLDAIVCPHLVILGENGFSYLQDRESDRCSPSQKVVIAGGHHCHLESPKLVAELIFGLVNKI